MSRLMNSEDFTRFLELLSSTSGGEDGGKYYCRLHGKLEGFFAMKGLHDPADAADATISIAVRRIAEGVPVPDAGKYCMGIARNIVKERLRGEHRESKAFLKFIEDLDNDSGEEVTRIAQVLKPCFELLPAGDKELLVAYCQVLRGRARAEHRRELAAKMKTTVQSLRMRVKRLRETLTECVEKRSNDA
jgi:DNA-directed RNA polymerase specialized sigma24 family protein